ncbi:putative LRR receptor-like serine/threonine-protein kinase MRH1 [Panicum miliaceum]|uniref:LRR receptor-like serine/threonine-protein kinase MRH1 n=1 Tax=Panicum miliaceum TaxID=4540 RepID=A0A3L6T280_PANMI|nr:putative LRR receptor-like serine/threonine-protein kinase MRH1 [Panicum miliaceum]
MGASSSFVLAVLTLHSVSAMAGCSAVDLPAAQPSHRRLLQDTNLAAHSEATIPVPAAARVPSEGSGSFPASSSRRWGHHPKPKEVAPPAATGGSPHPPSKSHYLLTSMRWLYLIVLPAAGLLLLAGIASWLLPCRKSAVATIGPWKTGLSGQLQKAFVTGVPKLQRSELERACEDFSNIITSYPHYTVYKGTLSSGVEIAVVSTMITSSKEWSEHSESCFRKKIDTLSRVNHKNFINLLGFCEEEEPFTRMLVLEYAPNGTLYESLHAEDFEHIGWRGRMRVIMGLAYCIQHMHELNPPVAHPDLQSSSILLSEDGAAKIVDMSVWHEVISKGKTPTNGELDTHHEQVSAALAGNVYSFGVLLLEIISGKLPDPAHERSLVSMALECINNGDRSLVSLLDPMLNDHKEDELAVIGKVIHACIQSDPRNRPSMREITARLREAIGISPVAATPRLSPLWWAELEVLSAAEAG